MATPPTQERADAPAGRGDGPLNWRWIALGGCLGLAAILLLNPISLMVIGMSVHSIRQERESDRRDAQLNAQRTAEAAALVCLEPPPGVLARIEAGLPSPTIRLRGARAVHSSQHPGLWVIAAEVEWWLGYEGEEDFAAWRLEKNPDGASPAPDDPITSVNVVSVRVSTFPSDVSADTFVEPAIGCTAAALGGA